MIESALMTAGTETVTIVYTTTCGAQSAGMALGSGATPVAQIAQASGMPVCCRGWLWSTGSAATSAATTRTRIESRRNIKPIKIIQRKRTRSIPIP